MELSRVLGLCLVGSKAPEKQGAKRSRGRQRAGRGKYGGKASSGPPPPQPKKRPSTFNSPPEPQPRVTQHSPQHPPHLAAPCPAPLEKTGVCRSTFFSTFFCRTGAQKGPSQHFFHRGLPSKVPAQHFPSPWGEGGGAGPAPPQTVWAQ